MAMKKILHISKYYYPYAGGVEDVCYTIVSAMQKKEGVSQLVFCFNDKNETIRDRYNGVDVHRAAIIGVFASQPMALSYGKELKRIIVEFQPDVIHFHAPNPLAAYYVLKHLPKDTKFIVHWHSDIVTQSLIYKFISATETKMLERADAIIATSPNYAELSKPLQKYSDKVQVIANVIDKEKFAITPDRVKQIEDIKHKYDNQPIVLFVGRHVPYKGLEYLIEAACKITVPCRILIGGSGSLTEDLEKQAQGVDNIVFLGRIADNELAAYYHAASIFAFPSITRNEAFGVVLAEAMYCKTPAVTFTIKGSGVNWVSIDRVTGLEVENSNAQSLASAIEKLIADSELRDRYAENAHQRVEELFIVDKIEEQISALYLI